MNIEAIPMLMPVGKDGAALAENHESKKPSIRPEPPVEADEHSLAGLIELLLKNPARVDQLGRDETRQRELIPRFLAIALASLSLFALVLSVIFWVAPPKALPDLIGDRWARDPISAALSLCLAFTIGTVAASGVCLPSFYFYGLLAGVKISMLQVTGHVMKGKSATSILLIGILPIYVALALGMIAFDVPDRELQIVLTLGLILPFAAGLYGVWSIFRGFMLLADTLPAERRCQRTCFLRRLTLAWAACYTAVSPVMIYRLWQTFAG
jgi:hypothetical protein